MASRRRLHHNEREAQRPKARESDARATGARPHPVEQLQPQGAAALSPVDRVETLTRADDNVRAHLVQVAQRGAGNAMVARTLARQPLPARAQLDEDEPKIAAVEEEKPEQLFARLPPGGSWLSGHGPNRAAETVEKDFDDLVDEADDIKGVLGFLEWTESSLGPRSLEALEKVRPVLEKKTAGVRNEDFNAIVMTYANASTNLHSKLYAVTAAEKDVLSVTDRLASANLAGGILGGKREEEKAGEKVKEIEADIETSKKWAEAIFEFAFDTITGDWKDALKDLGKFAGKELVGLMVEGVYSNKLEDAKAKLEAIKQHVRGLEDEKALRDITAEIRNLERATNTLKSKASELVIAVREAKAAYKVFEGRLRAMGKGGQAAADAIDSREEVSAQAAMAAEKLAAYGDAIDRFKTPVDTAYWAYFNYKDFLLSRGGENLVANEDIRARLNIVVSDNVFTAERLKRWIGDELGQVATAQKWVGEGSYMKSYEAIDAMLAEVAGGG